MQHHKSSTFVAERRSGGERATLTGTVKLLWPYIWPADRADLKLRVFLAVALMLLSKLITIAVPYAFKWVTDALAGKPPRDSFPLSHLIAGAAALTIVYGVLARPHGADPAGARRFVCGGGDERCPPARDRSLRASASSLPAFSSGAQDRGTDARSRARPQRHRNDHPHLDVDRRSDDRRVRD